MCIGTAQFGVDYGITNQTGKPALKEIKQIISTAMDNDIWFYDTAQSYGASEQILGKAFSDMKINNQVKCITKLDPNFTYNTFSDLKETVQNSLDKLNISCLWGLLIHRPEIAGHNNNFLSGIRRLKELNLIKYFGVSVYDPGDAIKFAVDENIDIIQVPFNVMDRRLLDNNFFEIAKENGKKIFIRSVFLQGLLLMDKKQLIDKQMGWTLKYLDILRNFVQSESLDLQSFTLNAVLRKIPFSNVIIGIESAKQLSQNIIFVDAFKVAEENYNLWWTKVPNFPDKFLNPSKWKN